MVKKGYTLEQIINKLREAESLRSQGSGIIEVCRKLGVSRPTYYRWRREYSVKRADYAAELASLPRKIYPLAICSSGVWTPLDYKAQKIKKIRGDRRGLRPVPRRAAP